MRPTMPTWNDELRFHNACIRDPEMADRRLRNCSGRTPLMPKGVRICARRSNAWVLVTGIHTSGSIGDMDDQDMSIADPRTGIPEWVGALAIRQCVKAGEHERDHPTACSKHVLEARRLAAWLAGEGLESDWDVPL